MKKILAIALALIFVLGCFAAYAAGASEGICVLCTFLGFILGAVIIVATQRMKKGRSKISFDIIKFT